MPYAIALDALIAFYKRWRGLLPYIPLIALIAFLWIKLYGFLWWDGAIEQRDKARAETAQVIAASKEALAQQIALNEATKAKYEAAAEKADHDHAIQLADAMSRTDRFIRAGGLRKAGGSEASVANAPAEGEAAGSSGGAGPGSELVVVSADDVRICTANTVRLQAVREWGLSLQAAGVAD